MAFTKRLISITLSILTLLQLTVPVFSQTDSLLNLPNLLIPRFTKSIVKLKSGEIYTATLNYNTVDQEMVFMQKNSFLVLNEPGKVDTIFMANRTFVPFPKGFYEVLVKGSVTLFVQNKSYVEYEGSPTLYGAKSQTTPPSSVRQIYGANGAINLKLPQGYKVSDDSQYWVRTSAGMEAFKTKKQFLKIFQDKKSELDNFMTKNKTDFKNRNNIVELIAFCNQLYK